MFNFERFAENLSEHQKSKLDPIFLNLAIEGNLDVIDFECMHNANSHQLAPTITFPNLLRLINRPIDFLKFDIEGYEKYVFEDYDLFKSKINRFAGEIHFITDVFPKEEVYDLLRQLRQDAEINLTIFSVNMVDITDTIWNIEDYYTEIIINGMVIK